MHDLGGAYYLILFHFYILLPKLFQSKVWQLAHLVWTWLRHWYKIYIFRGIHKKIFFRITMFQLTSTRKLQNVITLMFDTSWNFASKLWLGWKLGKHLIYFEDSDLVTQRVKNTISSLDLNRMINSGMCII